jgi:hypothetical protein
VSYLAALNYRFAAALIESSCRRSSCTCVAVSVTDPPADAAEPLVPAVPLAEAPPAA